jgi:hypothetical protein
MAMAVQVSFYFFSRIFSRFFLPLGLSEHRTALDLLGSEGRRHLPRTRPLSPRQAHAG